MRINHRVHRRLAAVLTVSLTCLALGACGSDSEKEGSNGSAGTSAAPGDDAASSDGVPVPAGMVEVEVPENLPDWMPRPKAPHVPIGLEDQPDDEPAESDEDFHLFAAAYAEDSDLEAEFDHFRQTLEQDGFSLEREDRLADVEGSPDVRQGSLMAQSDKHVVHVVLTQPTGEQPFVSVSTWPQIGAGLGE